MNHVVLKNQRRLRRKKGIRKRVFGIPSRPRLMVYRSVHHIYAQVIDDLTGRTIASASTVEKGSKAENGGNCDAAKTVGEKIAERAKDAGVEKVVLDRNGFPYHGRVKALADAAREGGLQF